MERSHVCLAEEHGDTFFKCLLSQKEFAKRSARTRTSRGSTTVSMLMWSRTGWWSRMVRRLATAGTTR